MRETSLEDRELDEDEEHIIRMLYYEDRILLRDVADILGPDEAMRLYSLKKQVSEPGIPESSSQSEDLESSIPDEIPDDVIDEVKEE